MGRTPDYLNVSFVAMAAAADYFAQDRHEFGENVRRYYELIREGDLCLTHTLPDLGDAQNHIRVPKPKRGACNRRLWELWGMVMDTIHEGAHRGTHQVSLVSQ